jgi:hypothetical protein
MKSSLIASKLQFIFGGVYEQKQPGLPDHCRHGYTSGPDTAPILRGDTNEP